ncbi:unnamed protein product [Caenorhabditis brenneri]
MSLRVPVIVLCALFLSVGILFVTVYKCRKTDSDAQIQGLNATTQRYEEKTKIPGPVTAVFIGLGLLWLVAFIILEVAYQLGYIGENKKPAIFVIQKVSLNDIVF